MSKVVTEQSWGSRIGGAFKGILIGLLLIVVGIGGLFWNEGRTIKRTKALREAASVLVETTPDSVDPNNEGKLLYLTGDAVTEETLVDPYFNVSTKALKLYRKVEIYQWVENVTTSTERGSGGSETTTTDYSYSKEWQEGLVDSSSFHDPGHDNPTSAPVESSSFAASSIKLGAFTLSPSLIDLIPADQDFVPQTASSQKTSPVSDEVKNSDPNAVDATDDDQENGELVPAETTGEYGEAIVSSKLEDETTAPAQETSSNSLPDGFVPVGSGFYKGDPLSAQIGDIRVTFSYAPTPTTVSVISQQTGDTFTPYTAKTGKVELLEIGTVSAEDMFASAQFVNKMTAWLIRLGGFLAIMIGFNMVLAPLSVLVDIIPFAGRIVGTGTSIISFCLALCISLITIAIGWIAYRPILAITLIAISVVAILFPLFRKKRQ